MAYVSIWHSGDESPVNCGVQSIPIGFLGPVGVTWNHFAGARARPGVGECWKSAAEEC